MHYFTFGSETAQLPYSIYKSSKQIGPAETLARRPSEPFRGILRV